MEKKLSASAETQLQQYTVYIIQTAQSSMMKL